MSSSFKIKFVLFVIIFVFGNYIANSQANLKLSFNSTNRILNANWIKSTSFFEYEYAWISNQDTLKKGVVSDTFTYLDVPINIQFLTFSITFHNLNGSKFSIIRDITINDELVFFKSKHQTNPAEHHKNKSNYTTDININNILNNQTTTAYPNPFVDQVYFKINSEEKGNAVINIYDALGKLVLSKEEFISNSNQELLIKTDDFRAGTYFYQVNINGVTNKTGLIVKQ